MMVRVVVIMSTYVDMYSNSNADSARSDSLLTRYIIQNHPHLMSMPIHSATKHDQKPFLPDDSSTRPTSAEPPLSIA